MPDDQPVPVQPVTHFYDLEEGQGQGTLPSMSVKEIAEQEGVIEKRVHRAIARTGTPTRLEDRQTGNRTAKVKVVSASAVPVLVAEIKRTERESAESTGLEDGQATEGQQKRLQGHGRGQGQAVQDSSLEVVQTVTETLTSGFTAALDLMREQGQGQTETLASLKEAHAREVAARDRRIAELHQEKADIKAEKDAEIQRLRAEIERRDRRGFWDRLFGR